MRGDDDQVRIHFISHLEIYLGRMTHTNDHVHFQATLYKSSPPELWVLLYLLEIAQVIVQYVSHLTHLGDVNLVLLDVLLFFGILTWCEPHHVHIKYKFLRCISCLTLTQPFTSLWD